MRFAGLSASNHPEHKRLNNDKLEWYKKTTRERSQKENVYFLKKIANIELSFLEICRCPFPINVRHNFWFVWHFSSTRFVLCRSLTKALSCQNSWWFFIFSTHFQIKRFFISSIRSRSLTMSCQNLWQTLSSLGFTRPKWLHTGFKLHPPH